MELNQNQIDYLLRAASQKLGVSETKLRSELSAGTFDRLLGTLPGSEAKKLTAALSNPVTAQAVLSSPQAKELMKKLFG
ncbi:MAG TPA: hypothetical protein IAD28_05945 [Candidatus Faeciplasma avium]|uniref:Uncharacterized protein n=1 Tax=Candidatus Faeciplasma avium TaxID=2840798 RepID=A0A9D1NSC6_9FIRM|nr:hypothetical protein [Candidatus Faeciplasma avium]